MEPVSESGFGTPRYEQIAVDIAKKIANGIYVQGDKLHGRSTLAGIYHVSPETIRKATAILEVACVLRVVHGNGALILSKEAAAEYVVRNGNEDRLRKLLEHFHRLLDEHNRLGEEMEKALVEIRHYVKTE